MQIVVEKLADIELACGNRRWRDSFEIHHRAIGTSLIRKFAGCSSAKAPCRISLNIFLLTASIGVHISLRMISHSYHASFGRSPNRPFGNVLMIIYLISDIIRILQAINSYLRDTVVFVVPDTAIDAASAAFWTELGTHFWISETVLGVLHYHSNNFRGNWKYERNISTNAFYSSLQMHHWKITRDKLLLLYISALCIPSIQWNYSSALSGAIL